MRGRVVVVVFVLVLLGLSAAAAAAAPPPPAIVTCQDAGWPEVRGYDRTGAGAREATPWGEIPYRFSVYPTYRNGVRVAVGDVTGDGRPEIVTAPANGGVAQLRVFDGRTRALQRTLRGLPGGDWWNGAFVALGDVNGDGRGDVVEGLDAGCCTSLLVLDASSGATLGSFMPFGDRSESGARVAAGDVNGDGKAELLSAALGSTHITAFGATGGAFRSFSAFGAEAAGGASLAAGDLFGDARAELVAAAVTSAGAQVRVLDALTGSVLATFFPYGSASVSSFEVAVADVDGDGHADVVVAAATPDGTAVRALDRTGRQLASFYALDPGILPGASLAAGDLDGDGKAELVLGSGPTPQNVQPPANGPDQRVAVFRRDGSLVADFTAYPGVLQSGVRVAAGDVNADGVPEVVTAPGPGIEAEIGVYGNVCVQSRDICNRLARFVAFEPSFTGGAQVAVGDVDGDGVAEIVVASGPGRRAEVRVFDLLGRLRSTVTPFEAGYDGGLSVAAGDLNADGRAEIVVGTLAAPARIQAFAAGAPFGPLIAPFAATGPGVVVGVADLAGDGRGRIVAGAAAGADPLLAVYDPQTGAVVGRMPFADEISAGVRIACGDLTRDGRDEIVVAPGWPGNSFLTIFSPSLAQLDTFPAYEWRGAGMNVALPARIGLPVVAQPRQVKLVARTRPRVIVARFRDADGSAAPREFRALVSWGDGTSWQGVVLDRGGGVVDVRSSKRYAKPGRYAVTVTLTDSRGRSAVARSAAVVRRR